MRAKPSEIKNKYEFVNPNIENILMRAFDESNWSSEGCKTFQKNGTDNKIYANNTAH